MWDSSLFFLKKKKLISLIFHFIQGCGVLASFWLVFVISEKKKIPVLLICSHTQPRSEFCLFTGLPTLYLGLFFFSFQCLRICSVFLLFNMLLVFRWIEISTVNSSLIQLSRVWNGRRKGFKFSSEIGWLNTCLSGLFLSGEVLN